MRMRKHDERRPLCIERDLRTGGPRWGSRHLAPRCICVTDHQRSCSHNHRHPQAGRNGYRAGKLAWRNHGTTLQTRDPKSRSAFPLPEMHRNRAPELDMPRSVRDILALFARLQGPVQFLYHHDKICVGLILNPFTRLPILLPLLLLIFLLIFP